MKEEYQPSQEEIKKGEAMSTDIKEEQRMMNRLNVKSKDDTTLEIFIDGSDVVDGRDWTYTFDKPVSEENIAKIKTLFAQCMKYNTYMNMFPRDHWGSAEELETALYEYRAEYDIWHIKDLETAKSIRDNIIKETGKQWALVHYPQSTNRKFMLYPNEPKHWKESLDDSSAGKDWKSGEEIK